MRSGALGRAGRSSRSRQPWPWRRAGGSAAPASRTMGQRVAQQSCIGHRRKRSPMPRNPPTPRMTARTVLPFSTSGSSISPTDSSRRVDVHAQESGDGYVGRLRGPIGHWNRCCGDGPHPWGPDALSTPAVLAADESGAVVPGCAVDGGACARADAERQVRSRGAARFGARKPSLSGLSTQAGAAYRARRLNPTGPARRDRRSHRSS